jgi:hypothetical protein
MEVVDKAAKKNEGARLVVAYPILMPGNGWMTDNEENIRKEFESAYNKQDQINISKVDCMLKSSQLFKKDGVRLTEKAGLNFVENLGTKPKFETGGVAIDELRRSVSEMREWRDNFTRNLGKRFRNDNLMFARMREELDAEIDRKKEDRTLMA